jgi:hypothetical protein
MKQKKVVPLNHNITFVCWCQVLRSPPRELIFTLQFSALRVVVTVLGVVVSPHDRFVRISAAQSDVCIINNKLHTEKTKRLSALLHCCTLYALRWLWN